MYKRQRRTTEGSASSLCGANANAPSTCPPDRNRRARTWSSGELTSSSTIWASISASARAAVLITRAKCGSSKIRGSGSDTTTATASVRRVTSVRAAWLGW